MSVVSLSDNLDEVDINREIKSFQRMMTSQYPEGEREGGSQCSEAFIMV